MNFRAFHWRLMAAFALFTLAVTLLFGLFAMAFVYTVEDMFIERQLEQEATRQRQYQAATGAWTLPAQSFIRLHTESATLPIDMAAAWRESATRKEFYGEEGRHYHVLPLTAAPLPLLVAEVSSVLIVRPIRGELLAYLTVGGLIMVTLALLLGAVLARRVSAPLEALAAVASEADPARLPRTLPGATRSDEVGVVARALQTLMQRTRDFIEREQAFTRDASHELRTPLAVMGMALERAQATTPQDAEAHVPLKAAAAAAAHMTQTVNTLLMLAREDSTTQGGDCAILPLVEQWVLAREAHLDARLITLDIGIAADAHLALPAAVAQVVIANLLDNAVTHGDAGGVISVRHSPGALHISNPSGPLPPGAGEASVKGVASAGFGLGLSIVRRMLARHAATLSVTHEAGVTTVSVMCPEKDSRMDSSIHPR